MPTKSIDRLLFAQGGLCFFCRQPLSKAQASVEHLVAVTHGGRDHDENCVVCCKSLNSLFGRMSLKEKLHVVMNQQGAFKCPMSGGGALQEKAGRARSRNPAPSRNLELVIQNLRKRGSSRPRTVTRLTSTVNAMFQKKLPGPELAALIEGLRTQGLISVDGTKVSYNLPSEAES